MRSILGLVAALGLSSACYGSILQQFSGPYTPADSFGDGLLLVNQLNDTGDWIDPYTLPEFTGTLYYGFDVTVTGNGSESGSGGFFTGLQLYTNVAKFGIGNNYNSVNWSTIYSTATPDIDLNSSTPTIGQAEAVELGVTKRIVLRIDFFSIYDDINGSADHTTVWLDPIAGSEESQPASLTTTLTDGDRSFSSIRLRAGGGSATYSNIVFGTTFADVAAIPEPSSMGLLLGAGVVALARRRRA